MVGSCTNVFAVRFLLHRWKQTTLLLVRKMINARVCTETSMQNDVLPNESIYSSNGSSVNQYEMHQCIADQMEALAIELRSVSNRARRPLPTEVTLMALAAKIYSARRKVDDIFGMQGFSVTPGWDIMLDLFQAKSQGIKISVTSACIGAACPPTTGLRWLQVLESEHLVERNPDESDRRRTVVELTHGGKLKVEAALAAHL